MKRLLRVAMFMALLGVSSCSDNSLSTGGVDDNAPVAVAFGDGVISRASGTKWSNDDRVGIYMFVAGGTTSYSYDGVTYSNIQYYNSEESGESATFDVVTAADVIYYPMDNSASDFLAIYPFNSALTATNFLYPLDVSDQSNKPAIDLMTASLSGVYTTLDRLGFSFSHRLSQLNFDIEEGDGDPSLDGLAITIKGLKNSATYDVTTSAIDFGDVVASNLEVLNQNAFVIPQAASNVVFHVSTTDSPEGFDTEAVSVDFKSGETTTIKLTLNRQSVYFDGSSTIVDWSDSDDDLDIDAQQVPVSFSIASRTSDVVGDATAVENIYTSDSGTIGIFMFDSSTTSIVNSVANVEYEVDDKGTFSVVDEDEIIYYPEGAVTVDFVAYAPHSETKVGLSDFTYEVSSTEQVDFLMATKLDNKTITTDSQSFVFSHMLSQIEVNVSSGIGSPSLEGLAITISGLIPSGTCVINADSPAVTADAISAADMSVTNGVSSIIIPQTTSLTFKVTTTSNSVGFTTTARSFTFLAGETTSVSLSLNLTEVSFGEASTVTPWQEVAYDDKIELF